MRLKIIAVLFLFIFIASYARADNSDEFKSICSVISKDFAELMSFENLDAVPDGLEKRTEDSINLQAQKLKNFVQSSPESIWADDAQYIYAALSSQNSLHKEAEELEYLLENYPNLQIEKWTSENLSWMIPKEISIAVRIQLLIFYKDSGEEDKMKALYEEAIKKFPEKAQLFKKIIDLKNINSSLSPLDNTIIAGDEKLEFLRKTYLIK